MIPEVARPRERLLPSVQIERAVPVEEPLHVAQKHRVRVEVEDAGSTASSRRSDRPVHSAGAAGAGAPRGCAARRTKRGAPRSSPPGGRPPRAPRAPAPRPRGARRTRARARRRGRRTAGGSGRWRRVAGPPPRPRGRGSRRRSSRRGGQSSDPSKSSRTKWKKREVEERPFGSRRRKCGCVRPQRAGRPRARGAPRAAWRCPRSPGASGDGDTSSGSGSSRPERTSCIHTAPDRRASGRTAPGRYRAKNTYEGFTASPTTRDTKAASCPRKKRATGSLCATNRRSTRLSPRPKYPSAPAPRNSVASPRR